MQCCRTYICACICACRSACACASATFFFFSLFLRPLPKTFLNLYNKNQGF